MKRSAIQWDEVRRRMRASELALNETFGENPARVKAVLRKRAMQLARGDQRRQSGSGGDQALIVGLEKVGLEKERYAVKLADLAEVLPFRGCTPVPGSPAKFLGVVNLRGELRPVVDLGILLSGRSSSDSGFILILRRPIGLRVDSIEGLRELRPEELATPEPGRYTRALLSETLKLLDIGTILSAVMTPKES